MPCSGEADETMRRLGPITSLETTVVMNLGIAHRLAKQGVDGHHPAGLRGTPGQWEPVVRVKTATIAALDEQAVEEDFPHLRGAPKAKKIAWLLEMAGYVAQSQAEQSVVNTPISFDADAKKLAYRPEEYGRALVHASGAYAIDQKGSGAEAPEHGSHSNGLCTLGECLREFTLHKIALDICEYEKADVKPVRAYGVIDWGFWYRNPDGSRGPRAGAILRAVHQREIGSQGIWDNDRAIPVEKMFRRHGLTTAGAWRGKYDVDVMNVQGTADGKRFYDLTGLRAFGKQVNQGPVVNLLDLYATSMKLHRSYAASTKDTPRAFDENALPPTPEDETLVPEKLLGGFDRASSLDRPWKVWDAWVASYERGSASTADFARVVAEFRNPVRKRLGQKPIHWEPLDGSR
jgi:hypothetical protein